MGDEHPVPTSLQSDDLPASPHTPTQVLDQDSQSAPVDDNVDADVAADPPEAESVAEQQQEDEEQVLQPVAPDTEKESDTSCNAESAEQMETSESQQEEEMLDLSVKKSPEEPVPEKESTEIPVESSLSPKHSPADKTDDQPDDGATNGQAEPDTVAEVTAAAPEEKMEVSEPVPDANDRNDPDPAAGETVSQLKELSLEEVKLREKRIRRLKAKLRNEEMKLILMKKIRLNQMLKENVLTGSSPRDQTSVHQQQQLSHNHQAQFANQQPNAHLVAGITHPHQAVAHKAHQSQQQLSRHSTGLHHTASSHISHSTPPAHQPRVAHESRSSRHNVFNPPVPQIHSRQSAVHGPPAGMPPAAHRSGSQQPPQTAPVPAHSHHQSQRSLTGRTTGNVPPNVVMGFPNVSELRGQTHTRSSPQPEPVLTPAQRLAAAKLAVKKQLEKTLMQIPSPKIPPPELHFVPNANNLDFIYFVGLENVVDLITESPNMRKPPPDPFECVHCGTDYTPVWKWQDTPDPKRNGRPAVVCESCVSTNIKRVVTEQQTSRFKKAFSQAKQQELEVERKFAAGTLSPPVTSPPPSMPVQQSIPQAHHSAPAPQAHQQLHHLSSHQNFDRAAERAEQVHRAVERERERSLLVDQQREHRNDQRGMPEVREHRQHREHREHRDQHRSHRDVNDHQMAGMQLPPPAHSSSPYSRQAMNNQPSAAVNAATVNANTMAAVSNVLLQGLPQLSKLQLQQTLQMLAQQQQFLPQAAAGLPPQAHSVPNLAPFFMPGALGMLAGGKPLTPDQIQAQFLLDLIPGARNLPQSSGRNWKS